MSYRPKIRVDVSIGEDFEVYDVRIKNVHRKNPKSVWVLSFIIGFLSSLAATEVWARFLS